MDLTGKALQVQQIYLRSNSPEEKLVASVDYRTTEDFCSDDSILVWLIQGHIPPNQYLKNNDKINP